MLLNTYNLYDLAAEKEVIEFKSSQCYIVNPDIQNRGNKHKYLVSSLPLISWMSAYITICKPNSWLHSIQSS